MRITSINAAQGVDVHLDPAECEIFVKLALDAEAARDGREPRAEWMTNYVSLSIALGNKLRGLGKLTP